MSIGPRLGLALLTAVAAGGCGSCQKGPPSELRVEGDTPYVRCLAADAPETRAWDVGEVRLSSEGRLLTIEGVPRPARIVAFAGPGPSDASIEAALAAVRDAAPHLVFVAGDIGDTAPIAERTLAALATLELPVLVIAGARDDAVVWEEAFEALAEDARSRVIDATPLRRIAVGADEWIPLAGAPDGRYARTATSCGFGEDDLSALVEEVGPAAEGRRRWLFAWGGPADAGLVGLAGADGGDPQLGEVAGRLGLQGGMVAWPRVAAPGTAAYRVVLPIAGPAVETADGRRLRPGVTLLELDDAGLAGPSS